MFGINHFGIVDYIVVGATLFLSTFIGIYFASQQQTKDDLLVGGRNMKVVPVAISIIVTYLTPTSIIGSPGEVYAYGSQLFITIILTFVFIPLSILIYVQVFHEMKLTSIYEYLELRFKSKWVRWLTSLTFILQILLVNAVTLFAPAIALNVILGLPVWLSITGMGIIGTVYTTFGGLRAVVWTDVFQFIMILIGIGAILVKGFANAGGVVNAFRKADEMGRLNVFDWTVDPFMRHNSWNFIVGMGFNIVAVYGSNQPVVQRYCSLPSPNAAIKSLLWTMPLSSIAYSIMFAAGITAIATYGNCCPILRGEIYGPDAIIPYFVIHELTFFPGIMGIFVSCIFSAVLSSVSSILNSLAAVTWEDFLTKCAYFRTMGPSGQANWTKVITAVYGVIGIGLSFSMQNMGTIFQAMMTCWFSTSGPLGGIFLCGLFLPFMNGTGAVVGILVGHFSMMFIALQSFFLSKQYELYPSLPTDLSECPDGTNFTIAAHNSLPELPELDYPAKLYTLSYLLYPLIGALITATVGMLVSVHTGGLSESQRVESRYIHPWIRNWGCIRRFTVTNEKTYMNGFSDWERGWQAGKLAAGYDHQYVYELVPRKELNNNNYCFSKH